MLKTSGIYGNESQGRRRLDSQGNSFVCRARPNPFRRGFQELPLVLGFDRQLVAAPSTDGQDLWQQRIFLAVGSDGYGVIEFMGKKGPLFLERRCQGLA